MFEHYFAIAPEAEISGEHQILWVEGNINNSEHRTYLKLFEAKKFNVKPCADLPSFTAALEAKINKTWTSKMTQLVIASGRYAPEVIAHLDVVTSFGLDPLVEIKVILFASTPGLKKLKDANPDIVKGMANTVVELFQLINEEASSDHRKSKIKKAAKEGGSQSRSSKKSSFFRLFKPGGQPRSAKKEYKIILNNLSIHFPITYTFSSDSNIQYDSICIDTKKIGREALVLDRKSSPTCFEADEFEATTTFGIGEGQQRKNKSFTFPVKGLSLNGTKKHILGSICIDFTHYIDQPAQKVDLFLS